MVLKVNGVQWNVLPKTFLVTTMDLDSDSTKRTADGTMARDRIAVKRQIEMEFGGLTNSQISSILTSIKEEFFDFYYPDPELGDYTTKTFYVGNRPASIAIEKNGELIWTGLKITLTER